jgi:hypothetical protein
LLEDDAASSYAVSDEILRGSIECFVIDHRQAKLERLHWAIAGQWFRRAREMTVSSDDTAQIPPSIPIGVAGKSCAGDRAKAEELVVRREVRTLIRTPRELSNVLPATIGEKPVLRASHELGPVLEEDAVGRLSGLPMRENARLAVATVPVDRVTNGSDDQVA